LLPISTTTSAISLEISRNLKHVHFETKFVPYGKGVIAVSQDGIERYHSEIRPKKVEMRGIKKSGCRTKFFQLGRCGT